MFRESLTRSDFENVKFGGQPNEIFYKRYPWLSCCASKTCTLRLKSQAPDQKRNPQDPDRTYMSISVKTTFQTFEIAANVFAGAETIYWLFNPKFISEIARKYTCLESQSNFRKKRKLNRRCVIFHRFGISFSTWPLEPENMAYWRICPNGRLRVKLVLDLENPNVIGKNLNRKPFLILFFFRFESWR